MKISVLIPAGGKGSRMNVNLPKQYLPLKDKLGGSCVLECTLNKMMSLLSNHPSLFNEKIFVGISEEDNYFDAYINNELKKHIIVFKAGKERVNTVFNGLSKIKLSHLDNNQWVMVHDAARPCINLEDIHRLIQCCEAIKNSKEDKSSNEKKLAGAILVEPISNTIKSIQNYESIGYKITTTLDRQKMLGALTPQLFPVNLLYNAIKQLDNEQIKDITDESSAIERLNRLVDFIQISKANPKITYEEDLKYAQWLLDNE